MLHKNLNQTDLSKNWSRRVVVYQIYPRSFKDSNGDGVGDLQGIIDKLDYLNDGTEKSLGVEAIWLSPVYKSPMVDFGYDVSDYKSIDPIFGDLETFDKLIAGAHKRGIKVIMDFVPNHTSVEHAWFEESRSSKDNSKRDWYIWRDGKPDGSPHSPLASSPTSRSGRGEAGSPPNNWLSVFGGSGWTLDKKTGQYYFHSFLAEQADLNWRNEAVRKEMLSTLDFWLDRGVDGFRTDAVNHLVKDKDFRDDPVNPNYAPGKDDPYDQFLHIHSQVREATLDHVNAMCELLGARDDKFLVSEAYLDLAGMEKMYKACGNNLHAPFNFNLMTMPWSAKQYREFIDKFEKSLTQEQWPNYVMGNHDRSRVASRLGIHRARIVALLLMTLRGMPLIYYGDELGMEDVPISSEDALDPLEKNVPGMRLGRDPERTPMQWSDKKYAGFSAAKPWLPVSGDYKTRNVVEQSKDSKSILTLYRKLIQFRKRSSAILLGSYKSFDCGNKDVFAYRRTSSEQDLIVALNFTGKEQKIPQKIDGYSVVCNTLGDKTAGKKVEIENLTLRPFEGYLFEKL